jgi:hypothetical protein
MACQDYPRTFLGEPLKCGKKSTNAPVVSYLLPVEGNIGIDAQKHDTTA